MEMTDIKIINEDKTHGKNNENNDNNVEREEPLGSRVEGEMVAMRVSKMTWKEEKEEALRLREKRNHPDYAYMYTWLKRGKDEPWIPTERLKAVDRLSE
ncbi:hypothetical protein V1478_015104 [Vespula squamosa]|uniref:Chromo domain-containing protein n=1 Tax=Vespula squamosa TaxID=30214 RepID=A0ABD2A476_VESSQ